MDRIQIYLRSDLPLGPAQKETETALAPLSRMNKCVRIRPRFGIKQLRQLAMLATIRRASPRVKRSGVVSGRGKRRDQSAGARLKAAPYHQW
jgi:hypothetical protein